MLKAVRPWINVPLRCVRRCKLPLRTSRRTSYSGLYAVRSTWMTLISPIHSPCQSPSRTFGIGDGYKAGWGCRYVLSILGDFLLPRQLSTPSLLSARCLLPGNSLPPTTITCRVLKATTSSTHWMPFPRRLPGRRRSLILHPRFAPIPPPATAMLNHCVP